MAIPTTFCMACAAAINLLLNQQMTTEDACRASIQAHLQHEEKLGSRAGLLQALSLQVADHGKSLDLNTYQAARSYDVTLQLPFGVQQVHWIFFDEVFESNPHKVQFRALAHLAASRDTRTPLWYVYVPLDEEQKVATVKLFARNIHGGCIEAPFFGVQLPLSRAGP